MNKFHIYILKMFIKYLILVDVFVSLMSLVTSVLGESKDLAAYDYTFLQFAELQVYSVSLSHNLAMPISSSVATIAVILLLMRSNELLAYITLGGKLRSLMIPFLLAGFGVAAFMLFWEYKVIPEVRIGREELRAEISGRNYVRTSRYHNLWLVDNESKLVNIKVVDMINKSVIGVTEYILNDDNKVSEIVTIREAARVGAEWVLMDKKISRVETNPPIITEIPSEVILNELWDDLVGVAVIDIRALSPAQLHQISEIMASRGMSVTNYDMLFYQKYANAISVIVLLICTFPIAINFSRNFSMVKNAAMMFSLGIFYWVLQSVTISLGHTGTLNPFFANFTPTIVFGILSIFIMYYRERVR